jgi:hypothetical protein
MDCFLLEMVLVVVYPSEQGGYEALEMGSDGVVGKGDDGYFDETKGGFHDFSVFRGEEDGYGGY